jgi:hypothetical protein
LSSRKPQDDTREDQLRALFGLLAGDENRIGTDARDAQGHGYELKTTTRNCVSTARDVSNGHVDRWRQQTWILGRGTYHNHKFTFESTYVLTPSQLEPWFSEIDEKLTADATLTSRVLSLCSTNDFSTAELDRIEAILKRGSTLNNPQIRWSYVQVHGTAITDDHAARLRQIVSGSAALSQGDPVVYE